MPTHYQGSDTERRALDAYIKLSRAAEAVNGRVNGHLHQHGLTTSQFGVLEALYFRGPMPVGQLADKILRSSANLTLVVDNLAKRGLVGRTRRPDDRLPHVVQFSKTACHVGTPPDRRAGLGTRTPLTGHVEKSSVPATRDPAWTTYSSRRSRAVQRSASRGRER